jgi:hypothetical protein
MIVTYQIEEMYMEIGYKRLNAKGLTYDDNYIAKSTIIMEAFDDVGVYGITRKFKIQL